VQNTNLRAVADLDPPLSVLESHGYLRAIEPPARTKAGGRPPSPSYLVHPEVHRPAATVHTLADARRSA
jgi:hypothetical protein